MSNQLQQSRSQDQNLSESLITPQQIYQTLIRQTPNLYPLCKFKTKGSNKHIFPDAVKFPDFFNYNLVSPGRVIKKLQGRQSLVRGFYYQLMKLAFEIQVQEKDYIQILKNVIFSPQFMLEQNPSSPSSGKNYSDLQYKKIVAQFMHILIHQSIPNFQLTILNYPIVDEAMLKILQNLLKFKSSINLHSNPQISSFQILQLLAGIFQVTVGQYGSCYKFQQSDIFLYEHSKTEYYIAFLNEMAEMSDMSESSHRKDSSYEPNSQKKIGQQSNESSGKKSKREVKTHEYLHSEYEIQSPLRRSQQQMKYLSSTEKKMQNQNGKQTLKVELLYGPQGMKTFKSITNNDFESMKSNDLESIKNIVDKDQIPYKNMNHLHRQSSESLVNQLHRLDLENTLQNMKNTKSNFANVKQAISQNVEFPGVKMSISVSNYDSKDSAQVNVKGYSDSSRQETTEKYQYQSKGYSKKVTFEQQKNVTLSNSSDNVVGYSASAAQSQKYFQRKHNSISNQNSSKFDFLKYDSQPKNNLQYYSQLPSSSQSYRNFQKSHDIPNYQLTQTNYYNSQVTKQDYSKYSQKAGIYSYTNKKSQLNSKVQEDIFYSPKPIISKPSFMPQSTSYLSKLQKNQQTVGTLYRQFTQTKILDILPDQVQYNIKRMKRKVKGVRSKDFFGFKKF